MKNTSFASRNALAAAVVCGLALGAGPASAHQTYNTGVLNGPSLTATGFLYSVSNGHGNGADGAINGSQGTPVTTGNLVWLNGTGAVSPEYAGNLPQMWYSGLHTTAAGTTLREFGSVSGGAGGTTFANPANSLQSRIATYNTRDAINNTTGAAGADGIADNINHPLPADAQIAVKGNSWLTGDGLDYGVFHVSCSAGTGTPAENCAASGPLNLSITLKNLNANSNTLLGYALYGGWDTSSSSNRNAAFDGTAPGGLDHPQGSSLGLGTLLSTGVMSSASDVLSYHRLFDTAEAQRYNGEYTMIIGALNNTADGQYYLSVQTQAVPIPAAVWLFGSALGAMGVIGRRKTDLMA
jgi:hypothetical protein